MAGEKSSLVYCNILFTFCMLCFDILENISTWGEVAPWEDSQFLEIAKDPAWGLTLKCKLTQTEALPLLAGYTPEENNPLL